MNGTAVVVISKVDNGHIVAHQPPGGEMRQRYAQTWGDVSEEAYKLVHGERLSSALLLPNPAVKSKRAILNTPARVSKPRQRNPTRRPVK